MEKCGQYKLSRGFFFFLLLLFYSEENGRRCPSRVLFHLFECFFFFPFCFSSFFFGWIYLPSISIWLFFSPPFYSSTGENVVCVRALLRLRWKSRVVKTWKPDRFLQPIEAISIYSRASKIGWPCLVPVSCRNRGRVGLWMTQSRPQLHVIVMEVQEAATTASAFLTLGMNGGKWTPATLYRQCPPNIQQPHTRQHGDDAGAAGDTDEERGPDPPPPGPPAEAGRRDTAAPLPAWQVQERVPLRPEPDDGLPHEEQLHPGAQEAPSPGNLRGASGPADPPRARPAEVLRVPQKRQVSRIPSAPRPRPRPEGREGIQPRPRANPSGLRHQGCRTARQGSPSRERQTTERRIPQTRADSPAAASPAGSRARTRSDSSQPPK